MIKLRREQQIETDESAAAGVIKLACTENGLCKSDAPINNETCCHGCFSCISVQQGKECCHCSYTNPSKFCPIPGNRKVGYSGGEGNLFQISRKFKIIQIICGT